MLQYTDAITRNNFVDDALYAALREQFDQTEMMKLCITVSFANLVNRVHATFRTDVDAPTLAAVADAPFCLLEPRREPSRNTFLVMTGTLRK